MSLFGYFYLGLQSMSAARLGLGVAGDNIANAATPGYARRRLELASGFPVQVPGGFLSQGVDVLGLKRVEDRLLQTNLEREHGRQAGSEELLRGLRDVEAVFGKLDQTGGIAAAFADFSAAFDELAAGADDLSLRRQAVSAAGSLAGSIRNAYLRLEERRHAADQAVAASVLSVNTLGAELSSLNREIATLEAAGEVAAPLRDRRQVVIEDLVALTGGSAVAAKDGRVHFSFSGGPTLVTGDDALPLGTSRAADGTLRVTSGADGSDITDRLRQGRLGAQLELRDDTIPAAQTDLDALAADLIQRSNALTTGGFDLAGVAGLALFDPDPPTLPGAARSIAVDLAVAADPALLAVATSPSPGDGSIAVKLAALPASASAALGGRSSNEFFAEKLSALGAAIVRTDVDEEVARALADGLRSQREAISGVSLDEEAVALMESQRSFEAAARFIQVLNSVTEVAVNLLER